MSSYTEAYQDAYGGGSENYDYSGSGTSGYDSSNFGSSSSGSSSSSSSGSSSSSSSSSYDNDDGYNETSSSGSSSSDDSDDSDDGQTAMEEWASETTGASINDDGSVSIDEQSAYATNTENWSGDETRASVEAGKAKEVGAISAEQEQAINDELAGGDVGAGDSGENTAADKLEAGLKNARKQADEVFSTTTFGGVDPDEGEGEVTTTSTESSSGSDASTTSDSMMPDVVDSVQVPTVDDVPGLGDTDLSMQAIGLVVGAVALALVFFGGDL